VIRIRYYNSRFIQYGWLPYHTTSPRIISPLFPEVHSWPQYRTTSKFFLSPRKPLKSSLIHQSCWQQMSKPTKRSSKKSTTGKSLKGILRNTNKKRTQKSSNNGKGSNNSIPYVKLRNNTDILETWMPVFPSRTTRKLRYSTNVSLSITSGVTASWVFSTNNLFDPDVTGTGHQPMGFDQLMLSYNHYCVTYCKMFATFKNGGSSTPAVAITAQANNTPITTIDQILESGMLSTTTLGTNSSGEAVKLLTCEMNLARFLGKVNIVDDPECQGSVSSGPTELEYFHVQAWDSAGASSTVRADIIMEFVAVFSEPRILVESLRVKMMALLREEVALSFTARDPSISSSFDQCGAHLRCLDAETSLDEECKMVKIHPNVI